MKLVKYTLAALGLIGLVAPLSLRADAIQYSFNGTLESAVNGSTLVTGTLTVDSTTGNLITFNFFDGSFNYTPADSSGSFGLGSQSDAYTFITSACVPTPGSTCADLNIYVQNPPDFTALAFAGGTSCFAVNVSSTTNFYNCPGAESQPGYNFTEAPFTSGSLTVVPGSVPEPSSLLLMGTGLLGLMGMGLYKRRLA